ncbi:MAG: outer membrane beta-barrel protein [Prevotella sp.]|nr:outer membrane beta-barrel protein [Prevotella sp.]
MKHTCMLLLCLVAMSVKAQRLSHDFQNASLSEALIWIDNAQDNYKLNFIFDELEDFTVTTQLKNASVRDAVRQVCGFYPMQLTFDAQDIYIECMQKSDTKLSGRIINESGQPVAYASISLLSLGDSTFLTGGVSNEAGDFVIPCKAPKVIARITCIGYKTVEEAYSVGNIGKIRMQPDKYALKGIEVKGSKQLVYATDRGLMANIQGTPLEQFGSVSEMLSHLPLMMSNGEIAGHGKPEIYINNKKVRNEDELNRLRADEILSAEIITNPGVEYGAEVTSVIRLKTIRKAGEGWSGNFSAVYSQGKEYYANGNAALNYRTRNGMDFFARGFLTSNNQVINATANDQLQASSTWDFQKEATFLNRYNYYFADLGWNWEISEKHSLGLTYTANNYITDATGSIETEEEVWRDSQFHEAETNKTVTSLKPRMVHAVNAYYVGEIGKWKLDFSADYYGGHSESNMEGGTVGEKEVSSNTLTKNNLLAEKLVVTAPIPKGTLTFGEEVSGVDRKSDFTQSGFSANNSVHQQTVTWSLFVNYALQVKKFGFNAGLRWQNEHNDYETNGHKDAEQSPNYHVFIPRLSLTYRTEQWTHTFGYQCFRRNPAYSTLSTAINYRSKYEYQTGNPYLRPTTTHYVSWTSNYRWVHAELYYQYIKNLNYSFQAAYDDTGHPGVILDDRRNVPQSQNYGLEINVTPKVGIWQMNYSADFFFNNRDLKAIGIKHKWNGLGTYFNLDNTLLLPNNWLLNIGMELTPYNEQGCSQTKTTGGMNLRLSRQFLKDKSLSIAFFANDILHTRYIEMTAYGGINVRTQFREYRDARRIGIDLSWKFNATKSRYKGSHAGQSERNRL